MDLNMPRMDGLAATKKIIELMPDSVQRCAVSLARSTFTTDFCFTRPSIVCLTANAMAEDRQKCLDAGAE